MIYRAEYNGTWYHSDSYPALCMFLAQLGARSFIPIFVEYINDNPETNYKPQNQTPMKQIAKIKELMPVVSGQLYDGRAWTKQNVVFTYNGSDTIFMVTFFGHELVASLTEFNPGDLVEVDFLLTAHEYGDAVFHDVRGRSIVRLVRQTPKQGANQLTSDPIPPQAKETPQEGVSDPQAGIAMPTEENPFN